MTVTDRVIMNVVRRLLRGEDYRIEVTNLIDAEFLQFTAGFLKEIARAKSESKDASADWYKEAFLGPDTPPKDMITYAGLNRKTIDNMYNSTRKDVVVDACDEHYDSLYRSISALVENERDMDIRMVIESQGTDADLSINECLMVINTLAVKRATIRGGHWSAIGKRVEKPLMQALCMLYGVPSANYDKDTGGKRGKGDKDTGFEREVDFYLIKGGSRYKCEVKLMGKGNPEGADAVVARGSKVFVADKLSETNKRQLDSEEVEWVELRSDNGFRRFETVLRNLGIPYTEPSSDIYGRLNQVFKDIFDGSQ